MDPPVDGYRIPKDRYYLRDPGLTPDELAALHLAASAGAGRRAVRQRGPAQAGRARRGEGDGEAGGSGLAVGSLPGGNLAPLFGAVTAHVAVRFTYRGEVRTIDPYRLDFPRGRWYLTGYDHGRATSGTSGSIASRAAPRPCPAARFERPAVSVPGVQLDPWELGEGEPVEARVRVDGPQAPWIVQHLGPGAVAEERPDGSVVVELPVTNRDAFRSFVLSFLDHAEVLEPADLRADIVRWLEEQAA